MNVGAPEVVFALADPTESYVATDAVDLGEHAYCDFAISAPGTSPTSWECTIQTSQDGTSWDDVPLEWEISAGAVPLRGATISLLDPDGTVLSGRITISWARRGSRYVRLRLKRTAGAATATLLVTASKGN